jgi:hypothetical protein
MKPRLPAANHCAAINTSRGYLGHPGVHTRLASGRTLDSVPLRTGMLPVLAATAVHRIRAYMLPLKRERDAETRAHVMDSIT